MSRRAFVLALALPQAATLVPGVAAPMRTMCSSSCRLAAVPAARGVPPLRAAPEGVRYRPPCMNVAAQTKTVLNVVVLASVVLALLSRVNFSALFFGVLAGSLKLAWRLVVFGIIVRLVAKPAMGLVMKAGMGVMMAGGPIRALRTGFFGSLADAFAGLAVVCSGRVGLGGLANFFGKLARRCDDLVPSSGPMDNGFAAAFGGGGGGANPFGGGGGGGGPFGGEDPFGAGAFGDMFGDAAAVSDTPSPPSPPPPAFSASSSAPGVTIKVRPPGGGPAAPSAPPPPPGPDAQEEEADGDGSSL